MFGRKLRHNRRGVSILAIIIAVAVGLFVASAILPSAVSNFNNANTTGWSTDQTAIWNMSPILALLGVAVAFVGYLVLRD